MLPDAPPYMKRDEEVARQLTDYNERLQHLERLEDPAGYNICRVYHDATQGLAGGINIIDFNSETTDIPGWHDLVINNSRITVNADGLYFIQAIGRTTANMPNSFDSYLSIYRNAGMVGEVGYYGVQGASISGFWSLLDGDFVDVRIWNGAGARVLAGGVDVTHFTVVGSFI